MEANAELPEPLVPADTDVSDLDGFMLNVERLLASELVAIGTPEQCWAAFLLWCRAFKQSPSGSLPNDDRILASFSGAGKRWKRVKEVALHGFVLCSDGRLYHRFLCTVVLDASRRKIAYETRREADRKRLAKWRANGSETTGETLTDTPDETRFVAADKIREDKIREERKKDSHPNGCATPASGAAQDDPVRALFDAGIRVLTNRGVPERQARSLIGKWRKNVADDGRLLGILVSAERENPIDPISYLTKAIERASPGWVQPFGAPGFA